MIKHETKLILTSLFASFSFSVGKKTKIMNLEQEMYMNNNRLISDYMGITSTKKWYGWVIVSRNGTILTKPTWTENQAWENFLSGEIFHKSMDWMQPVMTNILKDQCENKNIRKDIYGFHYKHNKTTLSLPYGFILTVENKNILDSTYELVIKYLKRKALEKEKKATV